MLVQKEFRHFSLWQKGFWLFALLQVSFQAAAQDASEIDQLTQRWLDTEHQSTQIQMDWQAQKPLLEQRLVLLKAEKNQLEKILQEGQSQTSQVDERRAALLAQQEELESQQAQMTSAIKQLMARTRSINPFLPPPLSSNWKKETQILTAAPDNSEALQVVLAQLNQLADFHGRISVHRSAIKDPNNQLVVVKQLYLGGGMAWFASEDGHYAGWGRADLDRWQWQFDEQLDGQKVLKAIAVYEKRAAAEWVSLPVRLALPNTARTAEKTQ